MNLTYFIGLVSKDLITFIFGLLTIAIVSAVMSTLIVEAITNIKKDVFNKSKLSQLASWIINLIANLSLVIVFILVLVKVIDTSNLLLYISLVFVCSYIISVLFYIFIIKNLMLKKEYWTNKNKIKKIQSDLELIELEEKINNKILSRVK
jgi:hypothetical protein